MLLGHTDSEFIHAPQAKDEESLRALATEAFGEKAEQLLSFFSHPATEESIRAEGSVNSIEFAVRAAALQQQRTGRKQPLYYYQFAADIPGWDHPGTFHSVDLWFFFETLAKCWRPFKGRHYDLARQMCDYWCNFIKTGDPNGNGSDGEPLPQWLAMDADQPCRMNFGETAELQSCPESALMRFLLEEYLKKGNA